MHFRTDAVSAGTRSAGGRRLRATALFGLVLLVGCVANGRPRPAAPPAPPSPPPAGAPAPVATNPVANAPGSPAAESPLRRLYREAAAAYAPVDSYFAQLRRREVVNGKAKPLEVILFKFRRRPFSVHFKWLGEEGKGRELLYVKGRYDDKLHVLLAAGDAPFMPAGKRMALDPNGMLARGASRHGIEEAGVGWGIEEFGKLVAETERAGGVGPLKYVGPRQRPEYDHPLEAVEHRVAPGREAALPGGGSRTIYFDPATHFPVMVVTYDTKGQEVEYYCFDRFQLAVHLDDLDFDPDRLWPTRR